MTLLRFEPFRLTRDIDRVFEEMTQRTTGTWIPRIDIFDRESALVVRAEIPAMNADDIDVTVEDSTLVISGTRTFQDEQGGYHRREISHGEFRRTIYLPDEVDAEQIRAEYRDGILEIAVPKRPEVLPRRIQIEVASDSPTD